MTGVELVLAIVKILIVLLFLLNMAAIATWADRRQGAMVQDRVGPNRAVVYLPSMLVRGIVLLPPTLLGALAALTATRELSVLAAGDTMVIGAQLAVLVAWFNLLVFCGLARRSGPINAAEEALAAVDPRGIFYGGVAVHVVVFLVTQAVPLSSAPLAARVACGLLAALLFASGVYAASRVPEGKVPLRLLGTLHAAADAIKMIWKEDFIPKNADRLLHSLAPLLAMFPALVTFAVIPFGDKLCFGDNGDGIFGFSDLPLLKNTVDQALACNGHVVSLQIADLNVGILYLFAMGGTGVIGAALAGWASDNKFSLLGGLRAASQMVSYEVAMGLSVVGLFIIYSSVRLGDMVQWQVQHAWGIFVQPFAFFLFIAALAAETKRIPFDQPEGESEIVAGYFVEYSGMKFGMFMTGEYVELITSSALLVTLFFGGYHLPFLDRDGINVVIGQTTLFQYKMTHLAVSALYVVAFFGKTILMSWVQVFFRWTLPRFRYDQVMRLGWTKLLPLAIGNMMVTGILVLAVDAAPAGLRDGLQVAADISQVVLAVGGFAAVVAVIAGLLEPVERNRFLHSTAARFAAAAGGTKASPQQA
ncbi:NADH dehydrogenase (ubiquinone) [Sorangium cellulosum]|uniref:NADH-quinone oxidoreductase subunit H n=1 Tax=Sorangium cellulosum TaxID=56 RepID=A0A4P2PUG8_SORCE|nr:complex I subunit 1 family protein [Sorangium cellulosum]AUX20131.1 NADH dehydrogenase (ubiquinone) [Sorangium cellulosum]